MVFLDGLCHSHFVGILYSKVSRIWSLVRTKPRGLRLAIELGSKCMSNFGNQAEGAHHDFVRQTRFDRHILYAPEVELDHFAACNLA